MTPTPKLVQIEAWSYSRFNTYSQCPRKAFYTIIEKRREPSSPALEKGSEVHAIADVVVSGKLPPLSAENAGYLPVLKKIVADFEREGQLPTVIPESLKRFEQEFLHLQKIGAATEAEWAFNRDWTPCDWFARQAWLRMKVDAFYLDVKKLKNGVRETTVNIIDHKTGKLHEEHKQQRSLYAIGGFLMFPDAVRVTAKHWYLDLGREEKDSWERKQLDTLKREWLKRTKAMLNDTTFAPRPGDYCRWCAFSKAKAGPCVF